MGQPALSYQQLDELLGHGNMPAGLEGYSRKYVDGERLAAAPAGHSSDAAFS
jgi:hypothetical protein